MLCTFFDHCPLLLTNSMEHSPSWEANTFSTSQEIPQIWWNPEGALPHLQVPTTCSYLEPDQTNPYPPSHFLKIHLNFIPTSTLGSSKRSPSLSKTLYTPLLSPMCATCPVQLILDLITQIVFGEEWRLLSSSLPSFLHSRVTSSLLGPNILLNTLFSNTLSLRSSLNVGDQISYPYKATGTTVVLHIVIFIFLDNKLEDNRFCTKW